MPTIRKWCSWQELTTTFRQTHHCFPSENSVYRTYKSELVFEKGDNQQWYLFTGTLSTSQRSSSLASSCFTRNVIIEREKWHRSWNLNLRAPFQWFKCCKSWYEQSNFRYQATLSSDVCVFISYKPLLAWSQVIQSSKVGDLRLSVARLVCIHFGWFHYTALETLLWVPMSWCTATIYFQ